MRVIRSQAKLRIYVMPYVYLEKARKIGGGVWNKREECWEFPLSSAPFIIEQFPSITIDQSARDVFKHYQLAMEKVNELIGRKTEPRKHPFLMQHQRMCRDIARYARRFAFYLDTGTGKTLTAYSIIEENLHLKWVVICPKSIVKAAWMDDHLKFFPAMRVLPLSKNIKSEDYRDIAGRWEYHLPPRANTEEAKSLLLFNAAQVAVINPESFKTDELLKRWNAEAMIVDESTIMRNMKSATTTEILKRCGTMERVHLLSGKPAPNNELEYFPQMLAINPALLGSSYFSFRARYFEQTDYFGYNWQMKPDMREEFSRRLAMGCVFVSKKECLDLPEELPPVMRVVELPKDAMKYYKDMEREKVIELESKTIAVQTKLASLMKLRQITSGFIIDTDEDSMVAPLHSAKLDELAAVVEELGENKAIIWVNFKREVSDIADMLNSMGKTYVTAYSGTKNVDESIRQFKSDEAQFIIAHPKTLKYGVTFTGESMVRNCTYAIYYSMSYSFEDYYQSKDRIYRKGQNQGCTYIFLVADNTIDGDIYDAIVQKGNNALIMENMIRRNQR